MDNKTQEDEIESEVKKASEEIKNSYKNTKEVLRQIKIDKEADLAKKEEIFNQYIEESDKYKEKKNKQLDLMNERLKCAAQQGDPTSLFAEMDNMINLMDSYSDDEVIQAVKDRQLKNAKTEE